MAYKLSTSSNFRTTESSQSSPEK